MKNFIDYDIYVTMNPSRPKLMVILDAGHGGIIKGEYTTHGKMYNHQDFIFYEGVQNREIVKRLAAKYKEYDVAHAFTTTSNHDESLDQRGVKIGHIVNTYVGYNFLLMSIHHNAAGESAHGAELWTTRGLTDSDYAANILFPYMYEFGLTVRINRAKENEFDKEENWKILRLAEKKKCMALLWEIGFFTNREEAQKMMESEFIGNVTNALYRGTVEITHKLNQDGTIRTT